MENKEPLPLPKRKSKSSRRLYVDYAHQTLKRKLLDLMGDFYCEAWDLLKAVYPTRTERKEAHARALDRMAVISERCQAIIIEMEGR